ncbi:MAG: sulfotransferase [Actinobacteria bacterium]|nr:sulfotransferase [Actinomycetota bacterium]
MTASEEKPSEEDGTEPGLPGHPPRVLYIGGGTKSGSTLLDLMLGQVPSFFSVGELRQIWQRGLVENSRCGCKERFFDCPFWTAVGAEAFGGWGNVDVQEVLALRNSLDTVSSLRALKADSSDPSGDERIERYVRILDPLLRAIGHVSGAGVIVDSSKTPSHALLLRKVPGMDLRLVHLVRDSRGVVYSWRRSTRGKERRRKLRSLRTRLGMSAAASMRWLSYNARIPSLGALGVPYHLVRYEDLVREPRANLQRVLDHAGSPAEGFSLPFLRNGGVLLGPNHTVYGNRLRFSSGELALRVDDEWLQKMPGLSRAWVTAMTFPLLRRYGYALRPRKAPAIPAPDTAAR